MNKSAPNRSEATNRIRLDLYSQEGYSRGRSGAVVLIWWLVQATVFRCSPQPMYGLRSRLLRWFGARIGEHVKIRPSARFTYPWKVTIGDHSWIGDHAELYSLEEIMIGEHCVVSQNSYLCTGSHDPSDPKFGLVVKPIRIEDGAWIASDVFIYPGITIHEMGVVAARSTVLRDVPAAEIHAGSPARYVRMRFPQSSLGEEERAADHIAAAAYTPVGAVTANANAQKAVVETEQDAMELTRKSVTG